MKEFSLEKVYQYSKSIEEKDMFALAEAKRLCQKCEDEIKELRDQIENSRKKVHNLWNTSNINIQLIQLQNNYATQREKETKELLNKLAALKQAAEERRQKLVQSSTRVKTFQLLKQKQRIKFLTKLKKIEAATIDEAAQHRYLSDKSNY